MKRAAVLVSAAALVLFTAGLTAQAKTNFAGKWTIVPDPNAAAGPGGAMTTPYERVLACRAGDVWTVERQGLTLLEAQGSTLLCVVGVAAAFAHSRSRHVGIADQLRDWFQSASKELVKRSVPYY